MIAGCHRARRLLDQRAAGLSAPERLRLEDHLQRCPRCDADASLLAGLAALADFDPPGLRSRARDRVIDHAIREGSRPIVDPAPTRSWRVPLIGGAGLAVAAATLAIVWSSRSEAPAGPRGDRVLAGALEGNGQDHQTGVPIAPGVEMTAITASELALGHARVAVAPASVLTWQPDQATLTLRTGVVRATVDPTPHQRFRIATRDFVAMVVGTELEVSPDRVRVFTGTVTIFAASGEVLVRHLGAGETWHRLEVAAVEPPAEPRLEPVSVALPAPTSRVPSPPATSAPAPARPKPPAIDTVLAAARSHLASGEIAEAEALIAEAKSLATRPRHRAEAATLHAEVALVGGDHERAVRRYLEVADHYRDLGAGENALFAAARVEASRGHRQRAGELYGVYLDRYPEGRFRAEATQRLDRLRE